MVASSLLSSSSPSQITSKIQEFLSRVEVLEQKRFSKASTDQSNNDVEDDVPTVTVVISPDESMRRARYAVETQTTLHYSSIWKWVPENYYHKSLEERAQCLHAPSIHYLCKSLLLENRKVTTSLPTLNDPTNPRFVLVVLQYASVLDMKKLITTIRKLRADVTQRLDVTQFDFRIANEIDNDTITGYTHNSVTPFGMRCYQQQSKMKIGDTSPAMNVPMIILSSSLIPLQFLWLGGGHVHLKLGLSASDFCYAFRDKNLIVADISRPRTSMTIGSDIDNDDNINQ